MNKAKPKKEKFKIIEEKAVDSKKEDIGDIEWEGEELGAESTTKLEEDKGTGGAIVIRFFDFAANPEVFRVHTPTANELFSSHRTGMEAMLWKDGLTPTDAVEPRLMFSKDKSKYRFAISCIPSQALIDSPQTLSQLIHGSK